MKEQTEFNPLMHELKHFSGSEHFYKFASFGSSQFIYTDGIMHLVQKGECVWLLFEIGSYQGLKSFKDEEFQTWELVVNDKSEAVLKCHDGDYNYLIKKEIPFTDIPLQNQTLTLYLVNGTLMLPSEY